MRTHFLKDLPIAGKSAILQVFPDFDFYNLRRVTQVIIDGPQEGSQDCAVVIAAEYEDKPRAHKAVIILRFSGVRLAKLSEIPNSLWLTELEIEDVGANQIEAIKFKAKDYGKEGLEVLAKAMDIRMEHKTQAPA